MAFFLSGIDHPSKVPTSLLNDPDPRAECCGVRVAEKHTNACPRVVEGRASRCGARPARGQKLTTRHDGWTS